MSKAAALQKKFGANIAQSLGVRDDTPSSTVGPPKEVIPMADKDRGRTRFREAGYMELENIEPDPNQVRKTFTEQSLEELANSIKRFGILQPIRIRWDRQVGKHVIVTGERRFRAAKRAGLETVPCIFSQGEDDESFTLQEQLTENCLREDLNALEQAKAFKALAELNNWNAQQLSEALCISKSLVSQRLAILRLPEDVKEKVQAGKISGSAAYQVAKLKTEDAQRDLVARVETERLTRDETTTVVGVTSKRNGTPAQKSFTKTIKLEKAQVTVKFRKKRATNAEVIAALEAAVEELRAA